MARRPGDVRYSDRDIAGIEPAVFVGHWESVDIADRRGVAAIVERQPGTRDCNSKLGGGWDERASRIL